MSIAGDQFIEALPRRLLFDVLAPTLHQNNVFARYGVPPDAATYAHVQWFAPTENPPGTQYSVEWSEDGQNWPSSQTLPITPVPDEPGELEGTQSLDAGQKYFYRVRATDGSETAYSNVLAPLVPKDLALQVQASVTADGHIQLDWLPTVTPYSSGGPTTYTIYRKLRNASDWSDPIASGLSVPGYVDSDTTFGQAFEYKIEGVQSLFSVYGYVYAGSSAPAIEDRGKVLLVVDSSLLEPSTNELTRMEFRAKLDRLRRDLVGDGWTVLPNLLVQRDDNDTSNRSQASAVKDQIQARYIAAGGIDEILLIGHVPVPYSGLVAFDGHGSRDPQNHMGAWSADTYYASGLGTSHYQSDWTDQQESRNPLRPKNDNKVGDSKYDQQWLPSPVTTAIGRIDFSDLELLHRTFPLDQQDDLEVRIMNRYLDKDHAWRVGALSVPDAALIDDQLGLKKRTGGAQIAWRSFGPLVGAQNIHNVDWLPTMRSSSYLWAYGAEGGAAFYGLFNVMSNSYFSYEDAPPANAVFTGFHGSFIPDFDNHEDLLRMWIGAPGVSLVSSGAGTALQSGDWFFHPMGLGEPIGTSLALTENNYFSGGASTPVYPAGIESFEGNVPIWHALMGDPTLRLHAVLPPRSLTINHRAGGNELRWTRGMLEPNPLRYRIYRSTSVNGPFGAAITTVAGNVRLWTDQSADPTQTYTYMVRAENLQSGASGSYYNLSEGALATAEPMRLDSVDAGYMPSTMRILQSPFAKATIFHEMLDIWDGEMSVMAS